MKLSTRSSTLTSSALLLCLIILCHLLDSGHGFTFSSEKAQKKFMRLALQRQLRSAEAEEVDNSDESGSLSEASGDPSTSSTSDYDLMSKVKRKNISKVDWAEVDRMWNSYEEDEVVKEKWIKINKNLQSGVRNILSSIFPKVVSMSSEAKVSGNCSAGILKWIISLRHLKDWSVKMLDAMGKPSSGIFEGAVTMFGNYHQCTKIRAPEEDEEDFDDEEVDEGTGQPRKKEFKEFFRGKFCVLEFKPPLPQKPSFYGFETRLQALKSLESEDTILKDLVQLAVFLNFVAMRVDICVPSLCSREDLQKVVSFLSKMLEFRGRVLRCEVASDNLIPDTVNVPQASAIALFSIVLAGFGGITIAAFFFQRYFKSSEPVASFLNSLTWGHAYQELTSTECYKKGYKVPALYGLRYLIMIWIIVVHCMIIINFQFFRELMQLKTVALSWSAQLLTKSAPQFDSLILLTAFCMAYYNEGSGAMKALKTVARKYLRITPIVMVAAGIVILLPLARNLLYGGPTWGDFIPKPSENCQNYGLANLLYVQNFQEPAQTCLPYTWLFCVEIQLALAFVPIFYLLSKQKKLAYVLLVTLVLVGFAVNVYNVMSHDLPPALLWTIPDPEQRNFYYQVHYFKPWTHLSVFAIGVLAGHICYDRKLQAEAGLRSAKTMSGFQRFRYSVLALVSLVVMFLIIYQNHEWIKGVFYEESWKNGLFDGLHRVLWASAQAYLIYYITTVVESNENSWITRFLCNHTMIVMGRLTLVAYVIHPIVQDVFLGTQQAQIYSSPLLMVYGLIGNVLLTYTISFILCILFELPCSSVLTARKLNSKLLKKATEAEIYANKSASSKPHQPQSQQPPPPTFNLRNGGNNHGDMELTKDYVHRF